MIADRFLLRERIGAGGMGTVWRADDTLLRRIVAVKQLRLPDQLADDPTTELAARALREAQAAARLNHPAAVTVYDAVRHDGEIFVVMEYVEAATLQSIIDRDGPLDVARVARIGDQVATVLAYAHERGVVHRDVKPANLMVFDDGRVKVADFGITRIAGEPAITRQGVVLGSPTYMAPEQLTDPDDDPAGDWWSLGATLYHAAEGRPPFPGTSVPAMIAAVLTREPDPPQLAGAVLGPVLLRLLAKNPLDRPAGDELREALAVVPIGTTTGMRIVTTPSTEVDGLRTSTAWRTIEPEPPEVAAEPAPVAGREPLVRPVFWVGLVALVVMTLTAALSPLWTSSMRSDLEGYAGLVVTPSFVGLRDLMVTGGFAALGATAVGMLVGWRAANGRPWWVGVLDWGGQLSRAVPVLALGVLLAAFPGRPTVPAVLAGLAWWPVVAIEVRAAYQDPVVRSRYLFTAIVHGAAFTALSGIVLQVTLQALTLGHGLELSASHTTANLGLVMWIATQMSFRFGLLPLGLLLYSIGALLAVAYGVRRRAGTDEWTAPRTDRSRKRLLIEFLIVVGVVIVLVAILDPGSIPHGWTRFTTISWPFRLLLSALIAALAVPVRWVLRRLPLGSLVFGRLAFPPVVLGVLLLTLHWLGPSSPTDVVGWLPHVAVAAVLVGFTAAGTASAVDATTAVIAGLLVIEPLLGIQGLAQATDRAAFDGVAPFIAIQVIFVAAICYGVAALRR